MNCPLCFQVVNGTNAFCPHCGARLAEPGVQTALEATQDPMYGALAHANLLRLRGDWEAAGEQTVAVMREFPNSGTAHSLMGDIYADQQMYEDAAQWYRMALDLEPKNIADSRKLAAAENQLNREAAPPDTILDAPTRFSVVRVAAIAAMVFLVFAISLGFYVKTHTVPLADLGPTWKPSVAPTVTAPQGEKAPISSKQPLAVEKPSSPPDLSLDLAKTTTHSARENELLSALQQAPDSAQGAVTVVDATIDPRDTSCEITAGADRLDASEPTWMTQLHAGALGVANRALGADARLTSVSIRVLMPMKGPNGIEEDVAFIGSVDRPSASVLGSASPPTAFTSRWWHPGLTPPATIAGTAQ